MVAKLQSDSVSMDEMIKQLDVPLQSAGALLRDDDSVPSEIVEHVFAVPYLEGDYPIYEGMELDNSEYAVVRLNKVDTVAEADAKIEDAEWISVQGRYGRREMSAMLKALRETGDVTVFPENL